MIDSGLGLGFGGQKNSTEILKDVISSKNISQILLTHGHIDHVGGLMALQSEIELEVIASEIEAQHLKSGDSSYIEPFMGSQCPPIEITKEITEGDVVHVGDFSFQILHTPGHTHGSISLWEETSQILISGDTVFPQGSFGRTDLRTGSSEQMVASLARLSKFDIQVLLPGHMPPVMSTSGSPLNLVKLSFLNAQNMLSYY